MMACQDDESDDPDYVVEDEGVESEDEEYPELEDHALRGDYYRNGLEPYHKDIPPRLCSLCQFLSRFR